MLVYITYIGIVCFNYGTPDCISRTYYLLKNGYVFTYWIIAIAFLLFPAWVGISAVSYQFITFLSIVFLCAVGIVPKYLDDQRVQHIIFTGIALILSIVWTLVSGVCIVPIVCVGVGILLTVLFPSKKLFILENAAFANIYLSVLVKIIILL